MLERGQEVKIGKKKEIVLEPDLRLHQKSLLVTKVDDEIRSKIDDMVATMIGDDGGVGLAAVQIGIMQRIIVIDCGSFAKKDDDSSRGIPPETTVLRMINPEVLSVEGSCIEEEGCLSVPGAHVKVSRAKSLKIQYLDYWGYTQEIQLYDWVARCILHEMDHLNGITLIDKISPLRKSLVLKKIQKMQKRFA